MHAVNPAPRPHLGQVGPAQQVGLALPEPGREALLPTLPRRVHGNRPLHELQGYARLLPPRQIGVDVGQQGLVSGTSTLGLIGRQSLDRRILASGKGEETRAYQREYKSIHQTRVYAHSFQIQRLEVGGFRFCAQGDFVPLYTSTCFSVNLIARTPRY